MTNPRAGSSGPPHNPPLDGPLLGRLWVGLYGFWTLLPNSNSLMVGWPWVILWQGAVMVPLGWCLWQGYWQRQARLALGRGWDGWMGATAIVAIASALMAQFPAIAQRETWGTLGALATVYALHGWLRSPDQAPQRQHRWQWAFQAQGYLVGVYCLVSLGGWLLLTYFPEQGYLATLATYDIHRPFDLNLLDLRNWVPLGHQNYGAGYLVLNGPILVSLALSTQGRSRWGWIAATALALITLGTTASRAGQLGLAVALLAGISLGLWQQRGRWRLPLRPVYRWGLLTLIPLALLGGLAGLLQGRLGNSLGAILRGDWASGELAYRFITLATGWAMGRDRPWLGHGLGSVPWQYQAHRPPWAGREAEWIHQLHNTPIQIWAEWGLAGLGILGILLILTLRLGFQRISPRPDPSDTPLPQGAALKIGLLAYTPIALTDYSLDNLAISGSLALFLALLLAATAPVPPPQAPPRQRQRWAIAGLALALGIAATPLVPQYRAWAITQTGFLNAEDDPAAPVTALTTAQRLDPQNPYYPLILGWYLGEQARQAPNPAEAIPAAITALERAIALAPSLEFSHSSLAWLALAQGDTPRAIAAFQQAWNLIPAKPGLLWGWAIALEQTQTTTATQTASALRRLEALRHPQSLVHPDWVTVLGPEGYAALLREVQGQYDRWLREPNLDPQLATYLHQAQGFLHWWQGQDDAAATAWAAILSDPDQPQADPTAERLRGLLASRTSPTAQAYLATTPNPQSPLALGIAAWLDPDHRRDRLAQAWAAIPIQSSYQEAIPPAGAIAALGDSLDQARDFRDWLVNQVPSLPQRNTRLGFGVILRRIDGPAPVDYGETRQNLAMAVLFPDLLPPALFLPQLDQRIIPLVAPYLDPPP